jgi:DNA-binding transcriptional MerR regulator
MAHEYRIGEAAARAGVTPDTLRYYERLGVLPRARRTAGGLRRYGEDVLRHLRFIQQARSLGLTLRDVRQLVGDQGRPGREPCQKVRDVLAVRLADVDAKLSELRTFRQTLRAHLVQCERELQQEHPTCPVITELARGH